MSSLQVDTPMFNSPEASMFVIVPTAIAQVPPAKKAPPPKFAGQPPTNAQLKKRLNTLVANDQRRTLQSRLDKLRGKGVTQ
jgi:hypothetical protein